MQVVSLLLGVSSLSVERFTLAPEEIAIDAATSLPSANCPCCGVASSRVHSRYVRKLADLPAHGAAVKLRVRVRRFFCDNAQCRRQIFAERLGTLAGDHARKTQRLVQSLCQIGLALGGVPASRLAETLAMSCGGNTMLRLVCGIPDEAAATPRVLGVDDWAFRRGHHYGTILCDLERHCPVDLLPDRTAQSLANWLEQHPGVEIISRDRAGFYAQGARQGAPHAVQVADRFHLVLNLRDALKRMLDRQQQNIREAARPLASSQPAAMETPIDTPPTEVSTVAEKSAVPRKPTARQQRSQTARARRAARYEQAVELRQKGVSQREIGHQLGLGRGTVGRYLNAGQFPERADRHYTSHCDPVADKICKRWAEGCHNAAQIARELIAEGFDGSYYMIRRRVHKMLVQGRISKTGSAVGSGTTATVKPPSSTRLSWLLLADEDEIPDEDRTLMKALYKKSAQVRAAGELARAFRRMVRQRLGGQLLEEWMSQATAAGAPREIKSFAQFLRQDYDAVKAGLTLSWSNGQVEGQVNRLKLIKRQMFGRADFTLLRTRVLRAG